MAAFNSLKCWSMVFILWMVLSLNFFPLKTVWQKENHSIAAKSQTSQQGATLKICSNNIKADMTPLLQYTHYCWSTYIRPCKSLLLQMALLWQALQLTIYCILTNTIPLLIVRAYLWAFLAIFNKKLQYIWEKIGWKIIIVQK